MTKSNLEHSLVGFSGGFNTLHSKGNSNGKLFCFEDQNRQICENLPFPTVLTDNY